jgi:hypothetical protein
VDEEILVLNVFTLNCDFSSFPDKTFFVVCFPFARTPSRGPFRGPSRIFFDFFNQIGAHLSLRGGPQFD